MNSERIDMVKAEGLRRMNLWLEHSSFDGMTSTGEMTQFNISLGLYGYPFKQKEWMNNSFNCFITSKEFYSVEYDEIVDSLYELANPKVKHPNTFNSFNVLEYLSCCNR